MELVSKSQSIFGDMVSELGLSAAMQPETEYTLLAPLNGAFSGEQNTGGFCRERSLFFLSFSNRKDLNKLY